MAQPVFVGIDVGSSRTKVAVLDADKQLIAYDIKKSGINFYAVAEVCMESSLKMANVKESDIARTISTGFGRKNISFANGTQTEIGCHSKGCYFYYPMAITIIDIGGQDSKIIKLDEEGKRISFKMNRKCAAGTGAFLEEMSRRFDIPVEDMDRLARESEDMVKLGSFCTLFSAAEVLENIRQGRKIPDIVKGLFFSVIKRVMELDSITENLVMTGGVVANNPYLIRMTEEFTGKEVLVPDYPQLTGAIGAALYAMDDFRGTE